MIFSGKTYLIRLYIYNMRCIVKCYHCGNNKITEWSNKTTKCVSCNSTIKLDKAMILEKSDDDSELRNILNDINHEEMSDFGNFSVEIDEDRLYESSDLDPEDFFTKVVEKEDSVKMSKLREIWDNSRFEDSVFEEVVEELDRSNEIIITSDDVVKLV